MVKVYNIINNENRYPKLNLIKEIEVNDKRVTIEDTIEILGHYLDMYQLSVEHAYIISFNNNMDILGIYLFSIGNSKNCYFYKKSIATFLLLTGAESFILYHNHPDGNLETSENDESSIFQINLLSEILEIEFIDSIIISKNGWYCIKGKQGETYEEDEI